MHCFFRISIAGNPPQTVVIQLHPDKCPITCRNFLQICKSDSIAKRTNAENLPTYRGTEIHRVVPNFMIQGGDFTSFDGKGGYAHSTTNSGSHTFPDENYSISHSTEGILSMANRGKDTNGSQFFITLGKCLHLDGKHVAFGKVVKGMEVVREIATVETDGDRPARMQRVVIVDCGEGWGNKENDDSGRSEASQSSHSRDKESKNSKYKRKKHHKNSHSKKHSKHPKRHRRHSDSSDDDSRRHSKKKRKKEKSKSKHRQKDKNDSDESFSVSSDDRIHEYPKKRHKC